MPPEWRHRIALYADDMAAGADTLEELFEIYKALVRTLAKAGIQIKSSKVEFGMEEITFHNYRVIGGTGPMANTTTPKDENLDPIKSCGIPRGNQLNSTVCPILCASSSTTAQTDPKGSGFPIGKQMDPWIRL